MVHPANVTALLETANGSIVADTQVTMQVKGIREAIGPYLLDETPDVLSIGTRCELHGYGFFWSPYSKSPHFKNPDGDVIPLASIDQVP